MALFLEAREIAELSVRRRPRVSWREAGRPLLLGQLIEMEFQLLAKLLIVTSIEERP